MLEFKDGNVKPIWAVPPKNGTYKDYYDLLQAVTTSSILWEKGKAYLNWYKGQILLMAKTALQNGEYKTLLTSFGISKASANNYIKIAKVVVESEACKVGQTYTKMLAEMGYHSFNRGMDFNTETLQEESEEEDEPEDDEDSPPIKASPLLTEDRYRKSIVKIQEMLDSLELDTINRPLLDAIKWLQVQTHQLNQIKKTTDRRINDLNKVINKLSTQLKKAG